MGTKGRIADSAAFRFHPWEAEKTLKTYGLNEVKFSRGFLRADFAVWFGEFKTHWLPFLRTLETEIEAVKVVSVLDFPEALDRIVAVEFDNEPGVIGLSHASEAVLVGAVARGSEAKAAEVIIEYLERRLLSSLNRSWKGAGALSCAISSSASYDEIEVSGVVQIQCQLAGEPCAVWLGLGPALVERLDQAWRERLAKNATERGSGQTVSVELAEIAVSAELVADYLKSGTVIALDITASPEVLLRVENRPWARGRLGQFNGRFAVEILELLPPSAAPVDQYTRLRVEVARAECDGAAFIEHQQVGAILVSKSAVGSAAALVISGEQVGAADVGQIGDEFAVKVLER